jgi:type II secretory pathway component PulF
MALYSYQAFSRDGKKVRGTIDASSLQAAREQITGKGLFPTAITLVTETTHQGFSWRNLFIRSVSTKDKIFFTKQLAVLLKAGVPLLEALELLIEQTEGRLRSIVVTLKDDIKEGKSLADGLSRYPKAFENIYIQLVRAGEASGRLEVILDRLTTYLERREAMAKRVRSALRGPLIQMGLIVVVVLILLTYVVPQIAQTFEGQGTKLPAPTRFLLALSTAVKRYYIFVGAGIAAIYFAYRWWRRTASGARTLDAIKLRLPIIKYFTRMGTVVQFSRTLGMLLEGGVSLPEALNIVVKIVNNRILVDELNTARENIVKQGRIAEYLKRTNIFPPVAIYLINTGEQSGQLDTMLTTVAEHYEAELTELADSLSARIAPATTVIMALVVGFIVISIVLPLSRIGDIASNF